jgi:acetyl-CoA C-acetyltransferase
MMARKYDLSRDALDAYALQSHQRAAAAARAGRFAHEIVPVPVRLADGATSTEQHVLDEGIRYDANLEAIRAVKLLTEDGRITAATSSQVCDGASGVLIANEAGLKRLGLEPLARVHAMKVIGHDPVIMLEAPLHASQLALDQCGLKIEDIDLYEVNEAFAPVPLAWLRFMGGDPARLNVHGGAIALGHPLGASGTKLMATLVHALRQHGGRYGLQTMCEGGGLANVTIVERL